MQCFCNPKMCSFFSYISLDIFSQHGEVLTDEAGNPIQSADAIKAPKGWKWSEKDGWIADLNRAVDHDGE